MNIQPNFPTPNSPSVQAGRHNRRRDNDPVERFESSRPTDQMRDPREVRNGHRTHHNKYPNNNPQFRHGNALGSIAGSASVGYLSGISAAELHYPDGRWNLKAIADAALKERGLATEFTPEVLAQVAAIKGPATLEDVKPGEAPIRDLRNLKFSSIDNETSKDLDQLEWAERLPNGDIKVMVAVTDVDALVPKGSPIDEFSKLNGSSIYTPDKIFPMLPEKLSEDLVSLNPGQDRVAMVTEMVVGLDGAIKSEDVYRGFVHNYAKLDYPSVGKWLEGETGVPDQVSSAGPDMVEQIQLQNEAAERLKSFREANGALNFASGETDIKVKDGSVVDIVEHDKNPATELVENFMVSANGVMSRFLRNNGFPSVQRVVKQPEKWDRIVELAAEKNYSLPEQPDGKALARFLNQEATDHPKTFAELSGSVIRLIGRGEYQALGPGEEPTGHFGLGIVDYTQQTASMRRRGDILNIRLAKDILAGKTQPSYSMDELTTEAQNLTDKEALAKKAERQADKSCVATLLEKRIGEQFAAVVTGASDRGTYVKLTSPVVEGKLHGGKGLKVGNQVRVELESVNVEKGFIDFGRV